MMTPRVLDIGVIGFGPIGRRLAARVKGIDGLRLTALLVRPRDLARAREVSGDAACTRLAAFIERRPNVAIECASAAALVDAGPVLMAAGIDVMPLSLSAFGNPDVERRLTEAARIGPGRLEIPAGAIGALGLLAAGRHAGLSRVVLRATYPLARWQAMGAGPLMAGAAAGAPFFIGPVRQAVTRLPGHLNLSVAVALAGLGLDRTEVELCADDGLSQAEFTLSLATAAGDATLHVGGRDAPRNADPVDFTTFSLIRLLERRVAAVAC